MPSSLRHRTAACCIALGLALGACTGSVEPSTPEREAEEKVVDAVKDTTDPLERACALQPELVERIWRGYDPERSEDLTMVPLEPNYSGTFSIPNHSGPWDYLQQVPFVWYGPGQIRANGQIDTPASVTDIYSTAGALSGVDLPQRQGTLRAEAIEEGAAPKVIMLIVWDGVGRNVLERWPDAWPNLKRLEEEGTSYVNAVVGSSPSITPATHANMGTGTYPRRHRVTGIKYLNQEGKVFRAFSGRDPGILARTTYMDDIDLALGNEPKVGMIAWRSWHLGMLSHGTQMEGGDDDLLGLIGDGEKITGNADFYYTPDYLEAFPGLIDAAADLDRADGEADGLWMGHEILDMHDNPAWVRYEAEAIITTLEREGFGADQVPDLFSTNFKMTDIVGHQYGMDSREERAVLQAQDIALGSIIDYLDENVGDYTVIVTADHGHTPDPRSNGAWPIANGQLKVDLEAHFEAEEGTLVDDTSAVGIFLNEDTMDTLGIAALDVAEYLNTYTLGENWSQDNLPQGYGGRGDERLLAAAFPTPMLPEIRECVGP